MASEAGSVDTKAVVALSSKSLRTVERQESSGTSRYDEHVMFYREEQTLGPIVLGRLQANAVTIKVPVKVHGLNLMAVIDSGAEVSVMKKTRYHELPETTRPALQVPAVGLVVADKSRRLNAEGIVVSK